MTYASDFWKSSDYVDLVKEYERNLEKKIYFYENIDYPSVNFSYSTRYEYSGESI